MVKSLDMDVAISKILASDEIIVKGMMDLVAGHLEIDAGPVAINGDLLGGVQVKTADVLVVKGALIGEMGKPCHIEAKGDVYITGQVHYARISGRNVYIGEKVRNTWISVWEHVNIESDLIDVEIASGDLQSYQRRADENRKRLVRLLDKLQVQERQLRRDEVVLHKQCERTSSGLNFRVGEIVLHERDRIWVDLSKFYKHVADKSPSDQTAALREFFAKGIIGLLSKINRSYIVANRAYENSSRAWPEIRVLQI